MWWGEGWGCRRGSWGCLCSHSAQGLRALLSLVLWGPPLPCSPASGDLPGLADVGDLDCSALTCHFPAGGPWSLSYLAAAL